VRNGSTLVINKDIDETCVQKIDVCFETGIRMTFFGLMN